MKLVRFLTLLDAYGGDLSVWPAPDRAASARLIESDPQAREALAQARKLDRLIRDGLKDERDREHVVEVLFSRPLPAQRRSVGGWFDALADWTVMDACFRLSWPRMAALICAGALGISIGLLTPEVWTVREHDRFAVSADSDPGGVILEGEADSGVLL